MPETLTAIANRINAHLKRFECDKKINLPIESGGMKTLRYFGAGATVSGRYVAIHYLSYQGSTTLNRRDAAAYLAWLDAGNVGTHWMLYP